MEDVAVIGFTDPMRRQIAAITDEQNVENLTNALLARIK